MPQQTLMTRRDVLAVAAATTLATVPGFAHHGWEGYLADDFTLTGAVEETVNTSGPHATMKVRANGQVWNVVLAPSPRTVRAGLKAGLIPVGETVTAEGHRHKNPKTFEIKTERLRWKDQLFNVYPERS